MSDSTRICPKCHELLPRTPEYWHKNKSAKDGLCHNCKACAKAKTKKWISDNYERSQASHRQYYIDHEQEIIQKVNDWAAAHPEHRKKYHADYYVENKEWFNEEAKKNRRAHPEETLARARKWLAENPERRKEISNAWAKSPKGHVARLKRRARIRELPDTFTVDEWIACIAYWEDKCAYCSKPMDKFDADHFIPLAAIGCPGTVVSNMLPACDPCNSSKQDTDPYRWVQSKFPTTFGGILYRIEAYFDSL